MKKAATMFAGFSLTLALCLPVGAVWDADYGECMIDCALAGDRERGLLYEKLRNAKIDALELDAQYIAYDDLVLLDVYKRQGPYSGAATARTSC